MLAESISECGDLKSIDVLDDSQNILLDLYKPFVTASDEEIEALIKTGNSFFQRFTVSVARQAHLIDAERSIGNVKLDSFVKNGDPKAVNPFLEIRLRIIHQFLENFAEISKEFSKYLTQDPKGVLQIFSQYLDMFVDSSLYNKKLFEALSKFKKDLGKSQDKDVRKVLLEKIVGLNMRFLLEPIALTKDLLTRNRDLFNKSEFDDLNVKLNSNPNNFDISGVILKEGQLSVAEVTAGEINTIISFSIPHKARFQKKGKLQFDNPKTLLEFEEYDSLYRDPIFVVYKDLSIGGVGWTFFSDVWNSPDERFIHIAIVIKEFFCPSLAVENGFYNFKFEDFNIQSATKHYPEKDFVIRLMLGNFVALHKEIEIERDKIKINLFSNFIVQFYNKKKKAVVCRVLFSHTNLDHYSIATDRYLERLAELGLEDLYQPIKDLIDDSVFTSNRTLSIFLQRLIVITTQHAVEKNGLFKFLWSDGLGTGKRPKKEEEVQPLIYNLLKVVCDYKGIQVSKEAEIANGRIDFICSTTTQDGKLLRVGVEVKNAHSQSLEAGISKQLPAHIESERTKEGIYIVLWYKGSQFNEPREFDTIQSMTSKLNKIKPSDLQIDVIAIDCSKPVPPSTL